MGENANSKRIRFGIFELDPRTRELRRNGVLVKLQDQPFEVLLALIEKQGELVSREDLEKRIWPGDTFVDFEVGLSRAVNKLREALGDTANNPRFVQTLPKRGYRFLAPVDGGKRIPTMAEPATPKKFRPSWRFAALAGLPLAVVGGLLIWQRTFPPSATPRVSVLTAFPGIETQPSFSPDGLQVAFVWDGGPDQNNRDIYVKLHQDVHALRLTTDPAIDSSPAWAPDGTRVAFLRSAPGRMPAVYLISPLGGDEQKIADLPRLASPPGGHARAISDLPRTLGENLSWSPDGKWLTLASLAEGAAGIYLLSVGGGDLRRLTTPKAPALDRHPVISPDGSRLAYAHCIIRYSCDIYLMELGPTYAPQGPARRVTTQGFFINGMTWAGDSVIYGGAIAWGVLTYLWRVKPGQRSPPERLDIAGIHAMIPAFTPKGKRLGFVTFRRDYDIWRSHPNGSQAPLITSSLDDANPQYSPDGKRIVFSTSRSGDAYRIWIANADGSNQTQLVYRLGRSEGSPKWSPDGRWIAFDSLRPDGTQDIWVIGVDGGQLRPFHLGPHENGLPSWSRDGKWIYFASDRSGRSEVWRVPHDGGPDEQVTKDGGYFALESTDGKTLFYTKAQTGPIFSRTLAGGPERRVVDYAGMCRDFAVFNDGIYYGGRVEDGRTPLFFHQFSDGTNRLIAKVAGDVLNGLTVSPDRKAILYCVRVASGSDLMVIENFR